MLVELIRVLFTKTYEQIFNDGIRHGRSVERDYRYQENLKIHRFSQEEWVGKKVIIISNQWENPFIGRVIGLEDFNRCESHIVAKCAITGEEVISFGKVIPFSPEILRTVVNLNPFERWEMLTGQKIERDTSKSTKLSTYDELMEILSSKNFINWLK